MKISLQQYMKGRSDDMREPKYYIAMDEYERGIIINSLNSLRNKLIADGRYTDAVDDVLVKIACAPIKRFRVRNEEA